MLLFSLKKTLWLLGLVTTIFLAFVGEHYLGIETKATSFFDFRAFVLVFVSPAFLIGLCCGHQLSIIEGMRRIFESINLPIHKLQDQLQKSTRISRLNIVKTEMDDSFLLFSRELASSGHGEKEVKELLQQKVLAEDRFWANHASAFSYTAKLAPYFGMLATVIGMVELMKSLQDFSQISSSIGMALLGTMYGLLSYLFVYGPIHKVIEQTRENFFNRNQAIARWTMLNIEAKEKTLVDDMVSTIAANKALESGLAQ
jgi:flagellar motor component MotA